MFCCLEGAKLKSGRPKLLNVLNLEGAKLKSIPKEVFKLFHLKYLNLRDTGVEIISQSIVFHEGDYSKNFAVCGFKAPREIGRLLSLEVLDTIDADNDETVIEMGKLTQLRELSITKLRSEEGKELCSSLGS
ncbi:hypothetical protein ACH5RR_040097 [Cinchona calisaya]|uniref:Disease resistance R13L4/SHOC-2-like LRR domain-containing protein n=1 Tax=Cinchona calisaya TaxID=153742 RepID=A0ABD2XV22_9GENT